MGEIGLSLCPACGLISNVRYDPGRLDYDEGYDNSLDYSPAFRAYAQDLAGRLRQRYKLRGKRIIEIGSGQGEFLKLLSAQGENHCTGYDPTFDGAGKQSPGVNFVQDYYTERQAAERVDFVACRHVLEHIPEPLAFLSGLHHTLSAQPGVTLYFEVPNAQQMLAGSGLWDVLYQHVHYFTPESLSALFRRAGFELIETGSAFFDQYLSIEARAGAGIQADAAQASPSQFGIGRLTAGFDQRFHQAVAAWNALLHKSISGKRRVVLWGAGAKGVTFLNVVPGARQIDSVVDLNPRKQGMYVPGTGQRIWAPEDLERDPPDLVITLNPAYVAEIQAMLADLGASAQVVSDPESVAIPPAGSRPSTPAEESARAS